MTDELRAAVRRLQEVPSKSLPEALEDIPTLHTLFALSEAKTRDMSRPTDPNDVWDIGFFAPAIPYCQVVVTEKYWSHIARATKLDTKYSCQVLARLGDLIPVLK